MQNTAWAIYSFHIDTTTHKVHSPSAKDQMTSNYLRVKTRKANFTIPELCHQKRFNLFHGILAHKRLTVLLKPRRYRKACWKGNYIKKSLVDQGSRRAQGCRRRTLVRLEIPFKLLERLRRLIWGIRSLQEGSPIDTVSKSNLEILGANDSRNF